MKTILLALLLTTTTAHADFDYTRVLQVEPYPCAYILEKVDHLTLLEATSDCRKELLVKKYRPYYKEELEKHKRKVVPVPVPELATVPLLLSGFLLFLGYRRRLKKD